MPKASNWKPSRVDPRRGILEQNFAEELQKYKILGAQFRHRMDKSAADRKIQQLSEYIEKLPSSDANGESKKDIKTQLRKEIKAMQTLHDGIQQKFAGDYKYNAETLQKIELHQRELCNKADAITKELIKANISLDETQSNSMNKNFKGIEEFFVGELAKVEQFIKLSGTQRGNLDSYTLPELKGQDIEEKVNKFTTAQTIDGKFVNSKDNLAFSTQAFYLCHPKTCEENIKAFYDLAEGKFNKDAKLTFNFEHDSLDSKQCATNPRYKERVQMMMKEHLARGYGLTADQTKMWDQMCGKNPELRTQVDDRRREIGMDNKKVETKDEKSNDNNKLTANIKSLEMEKSLEGLNAVVTTKVDPEPTSLRGPGKS